MGKIVLTANSFSLLENDKWKHAICGAMIGAVGFAISIDRLSGVHGLESLVMPVSWACGLGLAALAGAAKEAWDYTRGSGIAEVADFMWTVIGGAAFPLVYSLEKLIHP